MIKGTIKTFFKTSNSGPFEVWEAKFKLLQVQVILIVHVTRLKSVNMREPTHGDTCTLELSTGR